MGHQEIIISPYHGAIKKVSVKEKSFVHEWESLMTIKTIEDVTREIRVGLSGIVHSLEVTVGDEVIPGMVLAYIYEDLAVQEDDNPIGGN